MTPRGVKSLRSFTYVLRPAWWRYVLLGPKENWRRRTIWYPWYKAALCRAYGHQAIIYYSHALATEPDTRCSGCGEDLG